MRFSPAGIVVIGMAMAGAARAADPAQDLEDQYQTVVAVLKKPPVTGLVITEVEPESAAAARGLRAGDILLEYYGKKVTTLQALSELVAEAVGRTIAEDAAGRQVLVRFQRGGAGAGGAGGGEVLTVQLPRELLGIRAVEVQAGVPGPRNPPPNQRGTLALDWNAVLATIRADNGGGTDVEHAPNTDATPALPDAKPPVTAAFRLLERTEAAPDPGRPGQMLRFADEQWMGWELCTLTPEGDAGLAGTVDLYHAAPGVHGPEEKIVPSEHSSFTFHLQLGNYKTTPAFVLDQTAARYPAPVTQENMQCVATAQRLGEKLQVTSGLARLEQRLGDGGGTMEKHDNAAPLNAAPQCALPWIAAALPQEDGDGLAVYLLSVRDLLPRPGYVLATRGRMPLPADPQADQGVGPAATGTASRAATAPATAASTTPASTTQAAAKAPWRVDLMHFGVVIESYWFSDQRRLLCVATRGPTAVVARRAESQESAARPMVRTPKP